MLYGIGFKWVTVKDVLNMNSMIHNCIRKTIMSGEGVYGPGMSCRYRIEIPITYNGLVV